MNKRDPTVVHGVSEWEMAFFIRHKQMAWRHHRGELLNKSDAHTFACDGEESRAMQNHPNVCTN